MAKTIKDENGNTYVQKKPLYKKLWFWIVVVFAVFIVGGVFGGDSDDTSSGSSSSSKTEQTSKSSSSSTSEKSSSTSESSSSESVSAEFRSALRAAQTYSDTMHMSKKGLYDQLTSEDGEKFPADAAQYMTNDARRRRCVAIWQSASSSSCGLRAEAAPPPSKAKKIRTSMFA